MDEIENRVMLGCMELSTDEYFSARPQIDTTDRRRVFESGFMAALNRRATNILLISEQISSLETVAWQVCNGWRSCDLYRDKKTAEGDSYRLQKRADLSGNLMA